MDRIRNDVTTTISVNDSTKQTTKRTNEIKNVHALRYQMRLNDIRIFDRTLVWMKIGILRHHHPCRCRSCCSHFLRSVLLEVVCWLGAFRFDAGRTHITWMMCAQ